MDTNALAVANKLPLARIPWIPTKTCESMRLEDSQFYKKYLSNDNDNLKFDGNMLLYKFTDELFPYYLPKSYHAMDVVALEEMSSSTELAENFTSCNATYFFFKSCVYNDLAWTITTHVTTSDYKNEDNLHPKLKAAFFQNGVPPEQCGSAAEFILEPWVLSQLLFQPAILHQWVMAVYAEGLQLQAEIAALVHLPARLELDISKSIRYILKMLIILDSCVMTGLSVLEHRTKLLFFHSSGLEFFNIVLDLLPFLKLVLSKKVSHIIRAAKRMLWNGLEKCSEVSTLLPNVPSYKRCSLMYSFKYWRGESFNFFFFGEELHEYEEPPIAGSIDSSPSFVAWTEKTRKKLGSLAKWDEIQNFVDQKILKLGWIKGVRAKDVLKLVKGDMVILHHYLIYIEYEGMSSSAPGIRKSDTGMLQVIRTLQADNELANALAAMTSRIFVIVLLKYLNADIRLNAVDCEGPHMSMKEILSAVSLTKTKWSIKKLMKLLSDQIPAETGKAAEEPCPNIDTMEVSDIVSGLENRIKKLMFGIIKTFFEPFTANQSTYKVCYEAAFVQYVLPTFVVSFLRSTKNPEATLGDQKRHLSFVHHLIKTFEDPKGLITPLNHLCPEIAEPKKTTYEYIFRHVAMNKDFHVFSMGCGLVEFKHIEIRNELLQPYDETGRVPPLLIKSFLHFNAGLIEILPRYIDGSDIIDTDNHGFRITSPVSQTWTSWMSRYLTRIQFSLQKAYHGTEIIPVNHRLSMCLILCDFMIGFTDPDKCRPINRIESLFVHTADIVGVEGHLQLSGKLSETIIRGETECEAKKLSVQQIFAILFYHLIKINFGFLFFALKEEATKCSLMPPFHLDKVEIALYSILLEDRWRLKQIISEWLNDADGKTDLSLGTFEDVQAAPRCYEMAEEDVTQDGKVKMIYPGEITFFPIKHCRWCGLVDNGKKEMQLCKECQKTPKYPDKCFFCSQECEDKAMDILHREEHARYLMIKLDMID